MKLIEKEIQAYSKVQAVAKRTIDFLQNFIKEGVSVKEIVEASESFMKENGVDSFWYYNIGAFVFAGEETTISISGREYQPNETKVKKEDIVTVDLSPSIDGCWGDYARTFVVSDGIVKRTNVNSLSNSTKEFREGVETEEKLHAKLRETISEESTFEEIFIILNDYIVELGYENLDFAKNLGHTIEKNKDDRLYLEKGNKTKFKEVSLFTFEPHIKKTGGKYGFKREDIYYFQDNALKVL